MAFDIGQKVICQKEPLALRGAGGPAYLSENTIAIHKKYREH